MGMLPLGKLSFENVHFESCHLGNKKQIVSKIRQDQITYRKKIFQI